MRPLLHVLLWGYVAFLGGCSGNTIVIYGTGVMTMQSTNTQFVAYRVNIDSITMTRSDGIVVEPLLYPQTVDFTQITDIGEILGSPAIPTGTYTSATITFDYSEPSIWVESGGNAVNLVPVNPDGSAVTAIAVTINFDVNNPIVINSQVSSRIAVNVDLAAFNTINLSTGEVTVSPYALMAPAAVDQTPMRARGLFVTEMTVTNGFIMNARPFIDQVSAIGAEIVNVTPQTYWNINGAIYTGTAGLAVLNQAQVSTPIIAFVTLGNLSGDTPTFNATSVYVGTMAQDPLAEDVSGVVSARSGNNLTIRGGTYFDLYLENSGLLPTLYFNTVPVTISSSTVVLEDGNAAASLNTDAISVGQQVHIYGQGTLNSTLTALTLDASAGLVRIQPTTIWGTLNSATPTQASFDLLTIGAFSPTPFTFTGTGSSSGQDSNPLAYLVNTGSSNQSATPAGTLLRAQGLVTPFASAPPDFTASTIATSNPAEQQLVIEWSDNGAAITHPFLTLSASSIVVNPTHATFTVHTGPQSVTLAGSPTITYATSGSHLGVGVVTTTDLASTIEVTTSPADFVTAVNTILNGSTVAFRMTAVGTYDSTTNTFVASTVNLNCLL